MIIPSFFSLPNPSSCFLFTRSLISRICTPLIFHNEIGCRSRKSWKMGLLFLLFHPKSRLASNHALGEKQGRKSQQDRLSFSPKRLHCTFEVEVLCCVSRTQTETSWLNVYRAAGMKFIVEPDTGKSVQHEEVKNRPKSRDIRKTCFVCNETKEGIQRIATTLFQRKPQFRLLSKNNVSKADQPNKRFFCVSFLP